MVVRGEKTVLKMTRNRFSFPTGRSGFRQKAALIIFPEAMRRSADRRYDCQRATRHFGGASSTSPHISGRSGRRSAPPSETAGIFLPRKMAFSERRRRGRPDERTVL
jgi:hypothetical protein